MNNQYDYDYDLVKKCTKCGVICLKTDFHKQKTTKDGLKYSCKSCCINISKKYYNDNRNRLLNQHKKYWEENKEQIKKRYHENREKIIKQNIEYQKIKREKDPYFKLTQNLRNRIRNAFRAQRVCKNNKTFDLIGCSHSFLKSWINFQLYDDMTMQNYGKSWQLDHTIPISSFNLLDENEKRKCFSWVNLRPMYVKENLSKSDKIDYWLYVLQEVKARYFKALNEPQEKHN